ncbi:uncharacterized protein LOC131702723 [Acipenser ruthenus]|uniref:uncharacterized protein LOC131702723 n=1 Tax=Acipenser ruthenus TaxID=7906 RepID=UPI002740D38D|nr:uncharacterized protein LOC131702723 [Acipenser ruthenus]
MSLTLLDLKRATSNTVVQLNLCCEAAARTEIELRSFGGQTNPRAEKTKKGSWTAAARMKWIFAAVLPSPSETGARRGLFAGLSDKSKAKQTAGDPPTSIRRRDRETSLRLQRLNVGQEMEVGFVTDVAESLFSDGTTNWGRVVSLVAFGAVVARHLKQSGLEHCIEPLGERISSFLLRDKRAWMRTERGKASWISSTRRTPSPA